MKSPYELLRFALVSATGLLLAGCLSRPAPMPPSRFVLSPLPTSERAPATAENIPVGIGLVGMPPYLMRSTLAIRKGTNEIYYIEDALWAEPLDQGFQRMLAANLSRLLPTEQIYLTAWERDQVKARVFVNIERFDVDTQGQGTLTAWWRLSHPRSAKPVKSGQANLVRAGVSPRGNPQAMVATLSALTGEFSHVLAQEIRNYVLWPGSSVGPSAPGEIKSNVRGDGCHVLPKDGESTVADRLIHVLGHKETFH